MAACYSNISRYPKCIQRPNGDKRVAQLMYQVPFSVAAGRRRNEPNGDLGKIYRLSGVLSADDASSLATKRSQQERRNEPNGGLEKIYRLGGHEPDWGDSSRKEQRNKANGSLGKMTEMYGLSGFRASSGGTKDRCMRILGERSFR